QSTGSNPRDAAWRSACRPELDGCKPENARRAAETAGERGKTFRGGFTMRSLLDSILDATESAQVTRENHDLDSITPVAPDFDPAEFAPTKEAAKRRASLDVSTGRVALMSARLLPWHGLGVVVSKATTSAEAIRFASLDWRVQKIPMQYQWN